MVESVHSNLTDYIKEKFYGEYLDCLKEFIRIPSLAPIFDDDWQTNGNLYKVCDLLADFAKKQDLKGATITALKDEGKSPFLIVDVAPTDASNTHCVLLYGHMDKQPLGDGWSTDPLDPVIKDGILYGRGSSDDGYAFFSALLSIKACQAQGLAHPRCVITIEGSEEGEIDDLMYYMETYKHLMGNPNIVICLDSGAATDNTLSITSTLRGCMNFDVKVTIGSNNMHSGQASGISPNPFNILITLLSRIQNFQTHEVIPEFQVEIPEYRQHECKHVSQSLPNIVTGLPLVDGVKSIANKEGDNEAYQLLINNSWKPYLSIIGFEGLPALQRAGNVVYKELKMRCSLRLPPTLNGDKAEKILREKLLEEKDDTFGAKVEIIMKGTGNGFDAPKLPEDLLQKFKDSNKEIFDGKEPLFVGIGGSIPFMEVFSTHFPSTNYLLTGVGLPDSNPHSANENLNLEFTRKFTTVLSILLSKI